MNTRDQYQEQKKSVYAMLDQQDQAGIDLIKRMDDPKVITIIKCGEELVVGIWVVVKSNHRYGSNYEVTKNDKDEIVLVRVRDEMD